MTGIGESVRPAASAREREGDATMSSQRNARAAPGLRGGEEQGNERPRGRGGRKSEPRAAAAQSQAAQPGQPPLSVPDGIVLVIGAMSEWAPDEADRPAGSRIVFAEYADISAELIERVAPAMIVSSVIATTFDAFDLAQDLQEFGYGGPYRALTPHLPDPDLVRREVASCAPDLDFELLVVEPPATDGKDGRGKLDGGGKLDGKDG